MTKSATDVMQEIIYAAVVDALEALKASSKGVPNTMLRELNAIHANATFADLPQELQAAIGASVRGAFNRLLKEGYSVAPRDAAPPRPAPDRRVPEGPRPPRGGVRTRPGPPRDGPRPKAPRGPGGDNKPKPRGRG